MKLRQLPEDFKVTEVISLTISNVGKYKLYLLEKISLNTLEAVKEISQKNKIPLSEIGFAGLKDRHAVTSQYITVPKKYSIFGLNFIGFVNEPLSAGKLVGNKFEVLVRNLDLDDIKNVTKVAVIPNYFDSQRFGSLKKKDFIGRYVVLGQFEEAMYTYLTEYSPSESARIKEEKRKIAKNWPNFGKVTNAELRKVLDEYKKTKDWQKAYLKIPRYQRYFFLEAYQSYLWNECVKKLLVSKVSKQNLYFVPYKAGNLVFFKSNSSISGIPQTFALVSPTMTYTSIERDIIEDVLQEEKVKLSDFNVSKTGNTFGDYNREILVKVNIVSKIQQDTLNKGKKALLLSFSLPKGSYATVVIKAMLRR